MTHSSATSQTAHQSGVEQGRAQGHEQGIEPLFHRRLGRPLTDEERKTVRGRFDTHGADRIAEVVLDFSADALAAWLADADAT